MSEFDQRSYEQAAEMGVHVVEGAPWLLCCDLDSAEARQTFENECQSDSGRPTGVVAECLVMP